MSSTTLRRPTDKEYASFYAGYVGLVPEGDLFTALEQQAAEMQKLLRPIGETKSQHRYAPDKWSIREVIGHIADSERVFTYRALRFARGDGTQLTGYDENLWGKSTNAHSRTLVSLLDDLQVLRAATLSLFRGFADADWEKSGTASNNLFTVRALAYIVAGHERHHMRSEEHTSELQSQFVYTSSRMPSSA
jgi:hypothetical protein